MYILPRILCTIERVLCFCYSVFPVYVQCDVHCFVPYCMYYVCIFNFQILTICSSLGKHVGHFCERITYINAFVLFTYCEHKFPAVWGKQKQRKRFFFSTGPRHVKEFYYWSEKTDNVTEGHGQFIRL